MEKNKKSQYCSLAQIIEQESRSILEELQIKNWENSIESITHIIIAIENEINNRKFDEQKITNKDSNFQNEKEQNQISQETANYWNNKIQQIIQLIDQKDLELQVNKNNSENLKNLIKSNQEEIQQNEEKIAKNKKQLNELSEKIDFLKSKKLNIERNQSFIESEVTENSISISNSNNDLFSNQLMKHDNNNKDSSDINNDVILPNNEEQQTEKKKIMKFDRFSHKSALSMYEMQTYRHKNTEKENSVFEIQNKKKQELEKQKSRYQKKETEYLKLEKQIKLLKNDNNCLSFHFEQNEQLNLKNNRIKNDKQFVELIDTHTNYEKELAKIKENNLNLIEKIEQIQSKLILFKRKNILLSPIFDLQNNEFFQ